jgi:hypothetical protein
MFTVEIVKRAWQTLWRYRALWVWGIVLALTASSWSAWTMADLDGIREEEWQGLTITRGDNETFRQALRRTLRAEIDEANRELSELLSEVLHTKARVNVVALFVALIGFTLLLHVVGRIARYVSEVALIREVDLYQASGERRKVWHALRLGWSRSAWRLFLINLLVDVVGVGAAVLLFGLLFAPLPLWVNGGEAVIFLFAFLTAGLFFVALVAVILWGVALSVLKRLAWRACALDSLRVFPAIRQAYTVLVRQIKDVGLTWLVTAAVRWGWRVVMVPVALALVGLGLLTGSLPGLLTGGVTSLVSSGDLPVFLALGVGIPLFLLVLMAPLILLAGLREVFLSATWTLTYRELRALGSRAPEPAPVADAPGLEAAPAVP